jgi:thiamine-phosphate pyrophosphorylase
MKRIIDANLNRATEALRVLEEIARFYLDDKNFSEKLKHIRHSVSSVADFSYHSFLKSRDTKNDVGIEISNPSKRKSIINIFKANFKRLQQALRVLGEYSQAEGLDSELFEKARYETYTLEKEMFDRLSEKLNKYRLRDKNLYLVTSSDGFNNDNDFLDAVASSLKGGVQVIQLREKNSAAKRIIELGKKIRELSSFYEAIFIINDRIDIASIINADGVHLGQDDVDIKHAREILGQEFIIGLSTHSPEQAQKAVEDGADYIGVGPVFETPTKPGRKSVGLEYVTWASQNIDIPWYAIGGINLENTQEVIEAGASRLAVVRAIINADNPEISANLFLKKLNSKT